MNEMEALSQQKPEEIRQQIEETRSSLTDKLEALEQQVTGTVQSARETVERQGRAQGQGEKGGGQNSEHRHFERAADDLPENGIAARQKTDSI